MTEDECLGKMVPPGKVRPGKPRGGVIQIHVTRACDKACFACTQGSNLGGKTHFMTPEQFDTACKSLKGYFGTVGVFGGNPATSPHFKEYCKILRSHFPKSKCGLWCNNPRGHGAEMRRTFDPGVSNLNVHLDRAAYDEFKREWPESRPFGLDKDSRHSPPFVAMQDVLRRRCEPCGGTGYGLGASPDRGNPECGFCGGSGTVYDESRAFDLISNCDVNQHWSALIGLFRGELRAWFCEVAGAQAMLHQDEPEYPDTGLAVCHDGNVKIHSDGGLDRAWWEMPMYAFVGQVRKHCHECGVPLRGHGMLAQGPEDQTEQVSATHQLVYKPKRSGRRVELVTVPSQLGDPLGKMTDYMGNAAK